MLPVRYPSRDEARRYRHELRRALEALRGRSRQAVLDEMSLALN